MSNTCNQNLLVISRPSKDNAGRMCTSVSNLKPFDPLDKNKLSPRNKRGKIVEQIRDAVLLSLGAPVIRLEIAEANIQFAIDYVLKLLENYASQDLYTYCTIPTVPGKSIYELPPDVGYVRNVYYKKHPHYAFQAADLGGSIPLEYYSGQYSSFQGGLIDPVQPIFGAMGQWSLYKMYEQMFSNLSSQRGGFEFINGYRHIKIYPIPYRVETIIVHYMQRHKDWDSLEEGMVEGALAYTKMILGRIRGKYTSPPGVASLGLDSAQLLQEGIEGWKQFKEDLIWKYGDAGCLPITLD